MFPDKAAMIRRAKTLWWLLMLAPVAYILIAFIVLSSSVGWGTTDPGIIQLLLIAFLGVSAADISLVAYTQTSSRFNPSIAASDPTARVFLVLATGSVLSEALVIYGLVLTLLSGSLLYALAFSLAAWALLVWVRIKFTQNLERLPD